MMENDNPLTNRSKEINQIDLPGLKRILIQRYIAVIVIMILILFLPAWSLGFWPAWIYCAILFIPAFFVGRYLYKHDAELLLRRMRLREKEKAQKRIVKFGYPVYLAIFVIPGLEWRFHWSRVPLFLILIADAMVFLGYMLIFRAFRENSYASRVIEVEKRQEMISTGPYAVVRHPMYSGTLIMYLFAPLALASFWGLIPASMILVILVARIRNEEALLSEKLSGYVEYKQKVRWRLLPGIW